MIGTGDCFQGTQQFFAAGVRKMRSFASIVKGTEVVKKGPEVRGQGLRLGVRVRARELLA